MRLTWECVLCGTVHRRDARRFDREGTFCSSCNSTWRTRACAVAILGAIGAPLRPLPEQVPDWKRRGIGCSDHESLASALPRRFDYVNTFYHRFPKVDLLAPPDDLRETLDFIVCSDVLEHIPPNPTVALAGLYDMLVHDGFVVLSVPMTMAGETREFYPDLVSFEVLEDLSIAWVDAAGGTHVDRKPEYHGGPGQVLTFRLWSRDGMEAALKSVGFRHVFDLKFAPELGVPPLDSHGMVIAHR